MERNAEQRRGVSVILLFLCLLLNQTHTLWQSTKVAISSYGFVSRPIQSDLAVLPTKGESFCLLNQAGSVTCSHQGNRTNPDTDFEKGLLSLPVSGKPRLPMHEPWPACWVIKDWQSSCFYPCSPLLQPTASQPPGAKPPRQPAADHRCIREPSQDQKTCPAEPAQSASLQNHELNKLLF